MKHMRLWIAIFALCAACAMVRVGLFAVQEQALPKDHQAALQGEKLYNVADEASPYGPPPTFSSQGASQMEGGTPSVTYEDGVMYVRYQSFSGNTIKLRLSANGSAGSATFPADSTTYAIAPKWGPGEYTLTFMEMISATDARTIATIKIQCGGSSATGTAAAAPSQTVASSPSASSSTASAPSSSSVDTTDTYLASIVDINWAEDLTSVKKARELTKDATTDKERAQIIYTHLVNRMSYNYSVVNKLPNGYVPDMDKVYDAKTGICYDLSSLYAGMMRSLGVKCKLVMGYNSMVDGYHAWNEVYYGGAWHRVDLTIDCQLREFRSNYSFSSPKGTVTVSKSY